MTAVPQGVNYEIHYPMEKFAVAALAMVMGTDHEKATFLRSAEHAGSRTGGPLMRNGGVACAHAADLEDTYWDSLKKGVDPCYVDKRDGYVYMGEWVFVPTKKPMLIPDDDERFGRNANG